MQFKSHSWSCYALPLMLLDLEISVQQGWVSQHCSHVESAIFKNHNLFFSNIHWSIGEPIIVVPDIWNRCFRTKWRKTKVMTQEMNISIGEGNQRQSVQTWYRWNILSVKKPSWFSLQLPKETQWSYLKITSEKCSE